MLVLVLVGMAQGSSGWRLATAVSVAAICGALAWGSVRRSVAGGSDAIRRLSARLTAAAAGDLLSPTPPAVTEALPDLARAVDGLFSQVRASLDSVHALALYDPLTALANRLHFRREAERRLASVDAGAHAALLFLDLDGFKAVNDSLGHAMGDEILRMVANRLRTLADEASGADGWLVARLAGDEFTFFRVGVDAAAAARLSRRVVDALATPFVLGCNVVELGASVGTALFPDDGRDLEALIHAADVAMYQAKAEGRGRQVRFSPELAARIGDRALLDREMRAALERDEFVLHFQPLARAQGSPVAGVEALLRWRHPTRGTRLPGEFLAAAEDSGFTIEIGEWVVETAAATIGRWRRSGCRMRMAVNVSRRQIEQPGFFVRLRAAFAHHRAPLDQLELDLSETTAMQCSPAVLHGIGALRQEGVLIAIDDFGTGFSNLIRLKDFPVDRVKLDRSLTHAIAESPEARILVHSVVGLVHALGYEAVAEGVESSYQGELLRAIGCDLLQGYAIAPPVPEAELMVDGAMGRPLFACAG
nr:EAL domain-containing protein [Sphingomonas bacterium]